MGGVLPYKWEAYCSINGRRIAGFPFLRSLEARKARRYKWGAYCRTNWRCTDVLFQQVVGVGVSETLPIKFVKEFRLGGRFGYFLFFLLGGGEGGSSRRQGGGGGGFFIQSPRRGCRREGVWEFGGGGGAKYFFSGPKCPPSCVFPCLDKALGKRTI